MPSLRQLLAFTLAVPILCQDGYTENLYADYARAREARPQQRGEMFKLIGVGIGAFGLSTLWSRASKRKMIKDQKRVVNAYKQALAQRDQLIQQLQMVVYEGQVEQMERDYSEFKAPDQDGNDAISKPEFMAYMKQYVASQPGLTLEDFPSFEEWDLDGSGQVKFEEWREVMDFLESGGQTASQQSTKNRW